MATIVTREALDVVRAETGALFEIVETGPEATVLRFTHTDLGRIADALNGDNDSDGGEASPPCDDCADYETILGDIRAILD